MADLNRVHIENPLLLGFLALVSGAVFAVAIGMHPRESGLSHGFVGAGLITGGLLIYGAARRCTSDRWRLAVLLAGGLGLRALLLWLTRGTSDTRSLVMMGELSEVTENIYTLVRAEGRYVYSPVWSWVMLGTRRVFLDGPIRMEAAVKLPSIAADVVVLLALFWAGRRQGLDAGGKTDLAAIYFLNPVVLLVHSWHGQFGGVALAFIALAYLFAVHDGRVTWRVVLCLCLSVWVKQFTILWVIPFFVWEQSWPRRIAAAVLPPLGFMLLLVPYAPESFENVGSYHSILGGYGFTQLLRIVGIPVSDGVAGVWSKGLLLAVPAITWFAQRRGASLLQLILLGTLTFFVFTPGFAAQYYVWPLVCGALLIRSRARWLLAYTAVGTAFYLAYFCYWPRTTLVINLLTFGLLGAWFVQELRDVAPLPDWFAEAEAAVEPQSLADHS